MTADRVTINTPVRFKDPLPGAVDTVIIGGGVIGVFTALYLAQAGKKVLVCEKGRIAGEQSSRNWGWIRQHGRDAAELPIMMQANRLWQDVDIATKGQTGVKICGVTYIASTQKEMAALESWLPIAGEHGLKSHTVSSKEVAALFSTPTPDWVGGTTTPSDARGEPWQAVPAVAALAQFHGALIRENCAVRGLETSAGQISAVVTENGPVRCEQVVLAGGAWSALFARQHGISLPQLSIRSTVAHTTSLPDFFNGCAADEHFALRRRADGGYSIAASDKHDFFIGPDSFRHLKIYLPLLWDSLKSTGFRPASPKSFPDSWQTHRKWSLSDPTIFEQTRVLEPAPNQSLLRKMKTRFAQRFPEIGRPELTHAWAGMIDTMPDVVPVVDRAPSLSGLILATGMSGHGFGIGPGFGRIVARMATNRLPEHDLKRFRFSRFTDGSKMTLGSSL